MHPVIFSQDSTDAALTHRPAEFLRYPVDAHPAALYLQRFEGGSAWRTQRNALRTMAGILSAGATWETVAWHEIRYEHAEHVRAALRRRYAPATVNRTLSALRGVLKRCWKLGLMSEEAYRLAADVENVSYQTEPAGRLVAQGELRALFGVIAEAGGPKAVRDAAMLSVLYGAGLRRSELVALAVADYQDGDLHVRHGKRDKARTVYLKNGARDAVEQWLDVRGPVPGPLFCPVHRGGSIRIHQLSTQAVYNMLQDRAAAAGVSSLKPHDLRRSCATDMLLNGVDISAVAQVLGHANVQMVMRYDVRGEQAKEQAAESLHVPFVPVSAAAPRTAAPAPRTLEVRLTALTEEVFLTLH